MLSCEQFKFLAGADPRTLSRSQQSHLRDCPDCALAYRLLLALERRIEQALKMDGVHRFDENRMEPYRRD